MTIFNQANQTVTGNQFNSGSKDELQQYKDKLMAKLQEKIDNHYALFYEYVKEDKEMAHTSRTLANCYEQVKVWIATKII